MTDEDYNKVFRITFGEIWRCANNMSYLMSTDDGRKEAMPHDEAVQEIFNELVERVVNDKPKNELVFSVRFYDIIAHIDWIMFEVFNEWGHYHCWKYEQVRERIEEELERNHVFLHGEPTDVEVSEELDDDENAEINRALFKECETFFSSVKYDVAARVVARNHHEAFSLLSDYFNEKLYEWEELREKIYKQEKTKILERNKKLKQFC